MGYNYETWKNRMKLRSDLSSALIHLTRGKAVNEKCYTPVDILIKILLEEKLIASNPREAFIHGNVGAVCFQDAPIYSIAQNIDYEIQFKKDFPTTRIRYSGCGIILTKYFIFNKGGRPVIYDVPEQAKKYLNEKEYWRIVPLEMSDTDNIIDWTHEREWRVPGDLEFDLSNAAVLLENKQCYREFIKKCKEITQKNILEEICGIIVLKALMI